MGRKRLVPDENGRLPLSPSTKKWYDHWPKKDVWLTYTEVNELYEPLGGNFSTSSSRIQQCLTRGWLIGSAIKYEKTGRMRSAWRVPDDLIVPDRDICGECQNDFERNGDYLCKSCRGDIL
jgi:hypothetical protein